ncbi:GNAT family N-acetyltransferase [Kitasatospora viridis]|uniref:Acetyltransferase (GNAT) family protein n=1 Tax=Kitasatospora viridis TaxID=281105 RepID=A0A561UJ25_9ACTN|nr:GNAT family N-acetyltransferase [Kitasatospora viridis]TWF99372.1 acetyltransferase (GNAT) family protein [Kitasatospora viridis]
MDTNAWTFEPTPVDHPDAVAVLRDYLIEMIERYHGRPTTAAEVDEVVAAEPAAGLAEFLLARDPAGVVLGCIGLRRLDQSTGEVTKVFLYPAARGSGGGTRLLAAVEVEAAARGMSVLRLDTRSDLVEARALYARNGYREIPRYNDSRYSAHWFEKRLTA